MDTLPTDVKLYEIALDLDLHDLQHYCSTNRFMRDLCNNDNFWRQKTLHDFGNISNITGEPWRSIYINEYWYQKTISDFGHFKTCKICFHI